MTYGMQRVSPRKFKRSNRLYIYLSVTGVTVFSLFYLSAHVFILSLEESIRELQRQQAEITIDTTNLEIEIAELKKGSRIKKIAREQLGLLMPVGAPEKLF